jgi:hypothetical protein
MGRRILRSGAAGGSAGLGNRPRADYREHAMQEYRKRLGLGWAKQQQESASRGEPLRSGSGERIDADRFLEDALLAYAPKVLTGMGRAPGFVTSVFQLVDSLHESVSVLGPVIDHLRKNGYVDLVEQDLKGDHKLRLTERGRKVADES